MGRRKWIKNRVGKNENYTTKKVRSGFRGPGWHLYLKAESRKVFLKDSPGNTWSIRITGVSY